MNQEFHGKVNNNTKHDGRRWQRKPESRPDDILDSALQEFLQNGFSSARIEDIAKRAGLSKGAVYLYFKSKEDMMKALVSRSVIPIAENLKNVADHLTDKNRNKTAVEALRSMILLISERMSDTKVSSIPLLIISEAGQFPQLVEFYRNQVIEVSMAGLVSVIKNGVKSGEFRAIDPQLAVRTLIGALIMQIIWNGVFARPADKTISARKLVNSHLDLFLNGALTEREI